ncbi:peptidase inhibitor 15-like [Mytilus trossulus]|uniref:peptidase inhibitor 15-like n=1 Tax=Mytilus trossulus TaxID=6551 RepID=UPI003004AAE9
MLSLWFLCFVAMSAGEMIDKEKYKQLLLDEHSAYRRKQGASNMNQLVWDEQLEQEAGDWIKSCNFDHQHKGRGENLAFATGDDVEKMAKNAMKGWYDEINTYSYSGKACMSSCHYTQVVWAETRKVGCAINKCDYLSFSGRMIKNALYLACFYDPMGNDMSEYPYLKGEKCSKCLEGQTCDDGLCTGKGRKICEDKDDKCEYWESIKECNKNQKWMEKTCRKSCHFCEDDDIQTAGPACENKAGDAKCAGWKFSCVDNAAYMKKNCRKTCGHC